MPLWTAAPPFRKGREEGFSLQRPYNYGLISIFLDQDMIGAHNLHDHAVASLIDQEDPRENSYNYFNRFNPQIQYSFKNLRGPHAL